MKTNTRIVHELQQGSEAWAQFRLEHNGASEAAAMLGLSPYMTRPELLKMKKLGLAREFSDFVQKRVLDKGHEVEELARPHIEALIGEDLYRATYSLGHEAASCDGITIDDRIAFEHKQLSKALFAAVQAGEVPDHHMPQCQQVLMVTGAEKLAFVCSDGTPDRMAVAWVYPDPAWFQRLRDGWRQFERDLAAYVLPDAAEAAPVGRTPETLPALRIEITGAVTASNLAEFKATALGAIRSVNRDLHTDQHFADAEKAVKWCGEVEARLAAAKEHALSQTATIDELFKTIDEISAEARRVRLDLDKLVTRRKVEVKEVEVQKAREAFDLHLAVVNAEIAPARLQHAVDFGGSIKGLKTIDSVHAKLDAAFAAAKVEIDGKARQIRENLNTFKIEADTFEFLFADLSVLVHKPREDFRLLVDARITQHKAAEAKREIERQAAEAARIAAAEQRARDEARKEAERQAAEAARIAAAEQRAREEAAAAERQRQEAATRAAEQARKDEQDRDDARRRALAIEAEAAKPAAPIPMQPSPAVNVIAAPAASPFEPATLKLGAICDRLGFTVTAAFLADVLHVKHSATDKAARLYRESDWPVICRQLIAHISAAREIHERAAEMA